MRHRLPAVLGGLLLALGSTGAVAAQDLPTPRFDRIDYAHPEKYFDLPATLGKAATIRKAAADIRGKTPREKLASIWTWVATHLRNDPEVGYEFRDFDRILADGTYGGCQDHAEVFGALARACDIPTAWVKTMDADWIRMFRRTQDESRRWSGHVFLEVHLDGKWRLLDATMGILYEDYDVRRNVLPGDRFAYDKGGDYFELLMSDRWEDWKKQTARTFRDFDLARLSADASRFPPLKGTRLPLPLPVVVEANNPAWQWVMDRAVAMGHPSGGGGNAGFEESVARARDGWLVVVCQAGSIVLPEKYRGLLPEGWEAAAKGTASGVLRRKATDGTRVVFLFAGDDDALKAEIAKLAFDEKEGR